jgi:gas vesicle protein
MRLAGLTEGGQATFSAAQGSKKSILHSGRRKGNLPKAALIENLPHSLPGLIRCHPVRRTRIVIGKMSQPVRKCAGRFAPFGSEVNIMRLGRYESSEGNSIGTAVTFFLIGIGTGALVALALAPKTGKQFRRDLKRGYEDAKDTLQDWTEEAKDRARDAKERVKDVAERGVDLAGDLRDAAREKVEPLRRVINRG